MPEYTYYDSNGIVRINYTGLMVEAMDSIYSDLNRIDGNYKGDEYFINVETGQPIRLPTVD